MGNNQTSVLDEKLSYITGKWLFAAFVNFTFVNSWAGAIGVSWPKVT
jgi:hypothetical protein